MRAALAVLIFALPAHAAEPQLARVTLSSGGVGQFEFTADVDGGATVPLDVPLDQVDDILKSLRVNDPAGGVPTLRLPGRQPLVESFRTLPFPPARPATPRPRRCWARWWARACACPAARPARSWLSPRSSWCSPTTAAPPRATA